jgi:hypothetical protein
MGLRPISMRAIAVAIGVRTLGFGPIALDAIAS